jgi:Protein of unknown function (DUF3828)
MKRLVLSAFIVLFCGLVTTAQSTPEATIRKFYGWYVKEISKNKFPLSEQPAKMKQFITIRCYNENRKAYDNNEFDADYFIAAQDFDEYWATNVKVSNVKITGIKATANVGLFGKNNFNHKLKLKLIKQNGIWKIDVIDPIFD